MNTWTVISKELLNNNMYLLRQVPLLYFRCDAGHFTSCNTSKHRLFFCKGCQAILQKKDCDRFTDAAWSLGTNRKSAPRTEYNGKTLYKFPESFRRNYKRKKKE